MTESRMTNWDPEQELATLLDGLTEELLRAFDHEVSGGPGETSDERQDKADAVRRLVAAAEAEAGGGPVPRFVAPGSRACVLRNQ